MTTNATVTLHQLRQLGACNGQRDEFFDRFGDSVTVTRELCVQHAAVFDWTWAAEYLLSGENCQTYNDADNASYKVYDAAVDAAWEVRAAAGTGDWKVYDAACEEARKARQVTLAGTWADLFLAQVGSTPADTTPADVVTGNEG